MKKVILLALLMPYMAFGQIVENFESGEVNNWVQSTGGRWKADTSGSLSGKFSLHHVFDNPDAGTDRIGIPVKALHPPEGTTRWTFLIRYGYDPSSTNNWSVFLMSDKEPAVMLPDGTTNGYALGVNLTGYDDTLRLWKVKGNTITTVINCRINWQTNIGISSAVKIAVDRSPGGEWTISVFRLNGNLIGTTSGTENELFSPVWFGIYYRYSSTRDRLLWIDDISIDGNFYEDYVAPQVTACKVTDRNTVEIILNEKPADDFPGTDNFSLNASENEPVSVIKKNDLTYTIVFTNEVINKSLNNLIINKLCDRSGNCASNIQVPFTPVWAETGDVIISEIMADPLPEVSLPGKEYLEITNRTVYPFTLKNWKLSSDNQNVLFPETTIQPSEILIICLPQDTSCFTKYGKVIGLKQLFSLTDEGRIICLSDSLGNLIHGVEYSSGWYRDELKSNGGWSLEMIDTTFPFSGESNWIASISRNGGSPGKVNSVSNSNPDSIFYGVVNVFPYDSNHVNIRFSEPVFSLTDNKNSIKIDGNSIADIYPNNLLFYQFVTIPLKPLQKGKIYQIDISEDIKDFAGNVMQKKSFVFGLPESPEAGDLLFNELLFNAFPGDPDYIELYNCSGKIIDASRLQLVSVNDESGDTSQLTPVSDIKRCIMPGTYYAFTTDREKISERYFSANIEYIFETGYLPSMADDKGHLILFNRELEKIDEVFYSESMHDSLLIRFEGVAIEKTYPQNASEDLNSWQSVPKSLGCGTPGASSFFKDNDAPIIEKCVPSGKNSIEISLNERPADDFPVTDNFSLNDSLNKSISISRENGLTYKIEFANELINKSLNKLIINKICDRFGNCSQNIQISFTPIFAEPGDVIISEIMADPLPEIFLPGKAYLELTNRSEYSFNLKNWKLSDEVQNFFFPEVIIQPYEVRTICLSRDTSLFTKYGKVTGLKQFPTITQGGKLICLYDSLGSLIHGVEYSSDWYKDELKSGGGWSLEMIDTNFPFSYEGNWIASKSHNGGSPGSINSVSQSNIDNIFYGLLNVFPDDSNNVNVRFSEPVLNLNMNKTGIRIDGHEITDLYPSDPLFREFKIKPFEPLRRGKIYQIDISEDIKDFAGNRMQKNNYIFGLTEPAGSGDVLFNELLFNPLPGDPDYIELYNCSEKIIDASRLQIVSVNSGIGDTSQISWISDKKRCFMPFSYYAVTTDRAKIEDRYFSTNPECLFENESIPSMSDDEGHLILYNRELEQIDEVLYNEKMHYSLLSGYEGVSLEKTRPQNKSEEAINWHSASESCGWGTPGTANSVVAESPFAFDKVGLSSSKITPDNDGFEDILVIRFNLNGNGNVISVTVFDETGSYVKNIATNLFAGPEASIVWDGTADDGSPVNTGIYILFITLYDDTGKTNKWKKVCTVIRN